MSTAAVRPQGVVRPANRRYERVFFSGMAWLMLAVAIVGFWRTYYGVGMVRAHLPNALLHVHGALFTLWMMLLVVQTGLIAAHKVKVHGALGLAGMGLAVSMVVVALAVGVDWLRRSFAKGHDDRSFFIVLVTDALTFGVLIFFAYRLRRQPDAHKRLVVLATLAILDAAVIRLRIPLLHGHIGSDDLVILGLALFVVAYDLFSLGRIHRATLWGIAFGVVVFGARGWIGGTALWKHFADVVAGRG
jgi:hypothetical protein